MSTIKVNSIQTAGGLNGLTLNANGQVNVANTIGFPDGTVMGSSSSSTMKNRIINGAMVIDQRNAGASVTPNGSYMVDRWAFQNSQASKFTAQQNSGSVTPPAGYTNYLGFVSSSAYSVLSTDYFSFIQYVEGFNCADLAWGTASAATVTLSFWARSSLTGTFGGSLYNGAGNRGYVFSYTINSANTWEQKTITIAGDQSGTWLTTNGIGVAVRFGLGAGSTQQGSAGSWSGSALTTVTGAVNVVGTNGATFYITGVQLEKGSTATSFDYRPYGTELMLCQRYYQQLGGGVTTAGNFLITLGLYTPMRASPTVVTTLTSGSGASFAVWTTSQNGFTQLVQVGNNSTNSSAGVTLSSEL